MRTLGLLIALIRRQYYRTLVAYDEVLAERTTKSTEGIPSETDARFTGHVDCTASEVNRNGRT